ncbi:LTA synthase family protein [Streptococcus sanguinis]|uniref:LTA synthase family protein n=1 Tax=Streptococcus sanguinis TaxID=1305 RepID=A0A7H8V606_STRSA|nr:LTA synthase family protein [Streptococcus sanguinis]
MRFLIHKNLAREYNYLPERKMKFLLKHYKQFSYLLISFLLLDTVAVTTVLLLEEGEDLRNYPALWLAFLMLLPLLFGLGKLLSQLFSKRFFIWSAIIYALYTGFSYLLTVTQHVNDFEFKADRVFSNHFWQFNSLPGLLLIFLFAYSFIHFPKLKKRFPGKFLQVTKKNREVLENLFLSQLFLFLALMDNKMPELLHHQSYLVNFLEEGRLEITQNFMLTFLCLIALIFILLSFPSFLAVKGLRDLAQNKASVSVALVLSASFALIFNYTIQNSIRGDVIVLDQYLFTGASLFQIIVFFMIFMALYLIFNHFLLPTMLITALVVIATIASSLKFQYRQEPILPSDMVWLRNPKTLFDFLGGNYGFYAILGLVALGALYWYLRKKILPGKLITVLKYQLLLLVLPLVFFLGVMDIFATKKNGKIVENIPVISVLNNYHDLTWMGNTVNSQLRSLSFVWFSQMSDTTMIEPRGYSKEKIQEIEKKYKNVAEAINKERQNKIEDQTVIYLLSESFSDPARVDGVTMSENPIPYIQEVKTRTTSGLMKSDGYGGGTANMEFQTLTGLPFYNLSPSISVLYTEIVPKMNRFPSISDAYSSKNRTVIHLASPSNYARNVIYQDLGFDTFIHYGTKGLKGDNIGGNYSDQTTYNQVLEHLNGKQGQFFSVMTMQNHMPWSEPNPVYMSASYPDFSKEGNESLSSYVRMLYHTDQATKDFLEKLSKVDKKVTVVFYGDHLPSLYPQSAFKEDPESQYLTDYFVWSNYETPKLDYPRVNSSDFSALLLEQTNSKVSPYYALLTEVLHKASVDKKELDEEAQEIADDLKLIEYDMVKGKGYLSDSFFKTAKS